MSVHDDFQDSLALVSVRRVVRVVHRVSDRCCLEYDITHLTPSELSAWVKSIENYWDSMIFKFEFPHDLTEERTA